MAIKQRIAVHASEFHQSDVQPYDFILAMISRDKFKLTCLFDENQTNVRSLQLNPDTHYLFAYEIENFALQKDYLNGLAPNWPLVDTQFFGQNKATEEHKNDDSDEEMKLEDEKSKVFADELFCKTIPKTISAKEIIYENFIPVLLL